MAKNKEDLIVVLKEHPTACVIFLIAAFCFAYRSMLLKEVSFGTIEIASFLLLVVTGTYLSMVVKKL